jgi:hypothetical protein
MATGIREKKVSLSFTLCDVTNRQNASMLRMGQTPWRKNLDPVKIKTNPFTGESTNNDTKNVRATAVVPVIINTTTQSGRLYSFFRMPSIA